MNFTRCSGDFAKVPKLKNLKTISNRLFEFENEKHRKKQGIVAKDARQTKQPELIASVPREWREDGERMAKGW